MQSDRKSSAEAAPDGEWGGVSLVVVVVVVFDPKTRMIKLKM